MQFLKCVKVALIISGAAFAIISLPAAKLASERIDVQLNRSQVFSGEIRDLSAAYLSIAGLVSLSLGLTGFSLAAWRQTGTRLNATKRNVEELEGLLKQRDQQLQLAQLVPARLHQSGLNAFLEDDLLLATSSAAKQLPAAQTAPLNNVSAARRFAPSAAQYSTVVAPAPAQRRLSPSQASKLQAVQAQLQQQKRQAQQTVMASQGKARHNTGGFTVINPYQVQPTAQPGRQRNASTNRVMA